MFSSFQGGCDSVDARPGADNALRPASTHSLTSHDAAGANACAVTDPERDRATKAGVDEGADNGLPDSSGDKQGESDEIFRVMTLYPDPDPRR
jgi:hypothetical protein